jgi:hypothetical protein
MRRLRMATQRWLKSIQKKQKKQLFTRVVRGEREAGHRTRNFCDFGPRLPAVGHAALSMRRDRWANGRRRHLAILVDTDFDGFHDEPRNMPLRPIIGAVADKHIRAITAFLDEEAGINGAVQLDGPLAALA